MKKKKKNNNNNRFDYYTEAKAKYWNGKVAWGVGVLLIWPLGINCSIQKLAS